MDKYYNTLNSFKNKFVPPPPKGEREAAATNLISFLFYSCAYHGCLSCFNHDRFTIKHPFTNQSIHQLYDMTKRRERELKTLGYDLIVIWEHYFEYQ